MTNSKWTHESLLLMEKINNHFNKLCSETNYVNRLGEENNWTFTYTVRAVEEYKKFLFLFAIDKDPVSPSHPIDEAWHTHILYTKNYFNELSTILGKTLHHEPETGRKQIEEITKLKNWYKSTLERYNSYFGEEPKDIWTVVKKDNYSIADEENLSKKANSLHGMLYVNIIPIVILVILSGGFALFGLFWWALIGAVIATTYYIFNAISENKKERDDREEEERLSRIRHTSHKETQYSSKNRYTEDLNKRRSETPKTIETIHTTETVHHSGLDPVTSYLLMDSIMNHNNESNNPDTSNDSGKSSCSSCSSKSSCSSSSDSSSHSSCSSGSSCSSSSCSSGSSCGGGD
jgi:hypothetical protein